MKRWRIRFATQKCPLAESKKYPYLETIFAAFLPWEVGVSYHIFWRTSLSIILCRNVNGSWISVVIWRISRHHCVVEWSPWFLFYSGVIFERNLTAGFQNMDAWIQRSRRCSLSTCESPIDCLGFKMTHFGDRASQVWLASCEIIMR